MYDARMTEEELDGFILRGRYNCTPEEERAVRKVLDRQFQEMVARVTRSSARWAALNDAEKTGARHGWPELRRPLVAKEGA